MSESLKEVTEQHTFKFVAAITILIIALVGVGAIFHQTGEDDLNKRTPRANALDYYFHCTNCNSVTPCPANYTGGGISFPVCSGCGLRMNVLQRRANALRDIPGSNFDVAGGIGGGFGRRYGRGSGSCDYFHCPNCNLVTPCPRNYTGGGISCPACPSCGLRMNVLQKHWDAIQDAPGSYFDVVGGLGGRGMGGGLGLGPGGYIVCPDCGYSMPHRRGVPCYAVQCPNCGTSMVRQMPDNTPTAFNNNNRNSNNQYFQRDQTRPAPPITSNAKMPHDYRGVCSKCHKIIDR